MMLKGCVIEIDDTDARSKSGDWVRAHSRILHQYCRSATKLISAFKRNPFGRCLEFDRLVRHTLCHYSYEPSLSFQKRCSKIYISFQDRITFDAFVLHCRISRRLAHIFHVDDTEDDDDENDAITTVRQIVEEKKTQNYSFFMGEPIKIIRAYEKWCRKICRTLRHRSRAVVLRYCHSHSAHSFSCFLSYCPEHY